MYPCVSGRPSFCVSFFGRIVIYFDPTRTVSRLVVLLGEYSEYKTNFPFFLLPFSRHPRLLPGTREGEPRTSTRSPPISAILSPKGVLGLLSNVGATTEPSYGIT